MQNEDEEELGAPVNIYHEHRSHLEQDKKARIELDTHMLKDELYDPISTSDLNTTNATINNMNSNNMLWGKIMMRIDGKEGRKWIVSGFYDKEKILIL
ncbi:6564_t:CDS:2 [Entrophospora sp. SA101]|nr:6564_t:CDS:2 [Entrophospora sp. SA101]